LGQGAGGVSIASHGAIDVANIAGSLLVDKEFDHAANDSPRSGSSKRMTPAIWAGIVLAIVVIAIWFAIKA
jgi:hypothetical protein